MVMTVVMVVVVVVVMKHDGADWDPVHEVVAPDELLPRALALARTAAAIPAAPQLLRTYAATTAGTVGAAWATEQTLKRGYDEADGAEVGRRYGGIRKRGASQHPPKPKL